MATTPRTQIPLKLEFLGRDNKLTQPWAFYFDTLSSSLPPQGSGYVIDGTAGSTGPTTIYQGPASGRGPNPSVNSIYIADDTGVIYTVAAGAWQEQSGALTGDVTKPAHGHITTLVNVNADVGTFGDGSNIPVITVNAKGLITGVTSVPVIAPPVIVPGKFGDTIFKANTDTGFETFEHLTKDTFTVTYTFEYHFADATPTYLFDMPTNRRVTRAVINIETVFDDPVATLSLGSLLQPEDIMDAASVAPTMVGAFEDQPNTQYGVTTEVYLFINAGTATQGSGFVSITLSS
jgi:hypothetical protein